MALSKCPICGGAAEVYHLKAGNIGMGWMAGCKRFSLWDTIHGMTPETPEGKRPSVHAYTKEEAVKKWEEKVREWHS